MFRFLLAAATSLVTGGVGVPDNGDVMLQGGGGGYPDYSGSGFINHRSAAVAAPSGPCRTELTLMAAAALAHRHLFL